MIGCGWCLTTMALAVGENETQLSKESPDTVRSIVMMGSWDLTERSHTSTVASLMDAMTVELCGDQTAERTAQDADCRTDVASGAPRCHSRTDQSALQLRNTSDLNLKMVGQYQRVSTVKGEGRG